ncbi:hypothetical protein Tel_14440 [Candidatus Tenderia electrophaga]|jgi:hypothetical protein|uniref:Uncharacterized protein n=1 Tax=Candidatus Tenderia electrophaga TaxID=1748243 RepID=A0A0S2TGJ4_9GAMM|nr:hypothetical protein Tel_14440 [Candidatus Tenderia electrophaga]
MTEQRSHLPPASAEMENNVREVFPIGTDPEEFAAKDGVGWLEFTFHEYRFSDPELDSWMHTVGKIITDPKALEEVQRKHLSEEEFRAVRKYMEDDDLEEDTDF